MESRFDVLVVGAGPAGAVSAYSLARGGAKVALVDRVRFPRDKACGDLLSPRTIQALDDIGIRVEGVSAGDMMLIGPTGRSMSLPWPRGAEYPGKAQALPRIEFDEQLRLAALEAGAEFVHADVDEIERAEDGMTTAVCQDGRRISAPFIVGADGSLSRVAESAQMLAPGDVLWGFAMRYYADGHVDQPLIVYWEPSPGRAFPGYGWVFPNTEGRVNLGLGMSVGASRSGADLVAKSVRPFVEGLRRRGLVGDVTLSTDHRRGGWLKMGVTGTSPARGAVLLVGDASGLINPLAGEGISGAVLSGHAAAEAILSSPGDAATRYCTYLRGRYGDFYPAAAALQAYMAGHPRIFSLIGKVLTAPGVREPLSASWSMYWNDLVDGAPPGAARAMAKSIGAATGLLTATSRLRKKTVRHMAQ